MVSVKIPVQPPAEVSSNSRAHHMVKHRINKGLRDTARLVMQSEVSARNIQPWDAPRYHLAITIAWGKGRKKQDPANVAHCCKAIIDGIADAMGVNDARFELGVTQRRDPEGIGHVHVRISPLPEEA